MKLFGGFGTPGSSGLGKTRGMSLMESGPAGLRSEEADRIGSNEATLMRARQSAMDSLFRSAGMTAGSASGPAERIVAIKEGKESIDVDAMLAERSRRQEAIRAQQREQPVEPAINERRPGSDRPTVAPPFL